jgi:hypothetical protein
LPNRRWRYIPRPSLRIRHQTATDHNIRSSLSFRSPEKLSRYLRDKAIACGVLVTTSQREYGKKLNPEEQAEGLFHPTSGKLGCCLTVSVPSSSNVISTGEPTRVLQLGLRLNF